MHQPNTEDFDAPPPPETSPGKSENVDNRTEEQRTTTTTTTTTASSKKTQHHHHQQHVSNGSTVPFSLLMPTSPGHPVGLVNFDDVTGIAPVAVVDNITTHTRTTTTTTQDALRKVLITSSADHHTALVIADSQDDKLVKSKLVEEITQVSHQHMLSSAGSFGGSSETSSSENNHHAENRYQRKLTRIQPALVDFGLRRKPITPTRLTMLLREVLCNRRWLIILRAQKSLKLLEVVVSVIAELREHNFLGVDADSRIVICSEPHPHFPQPLLTAPTVILQQLLSTSISDWATKVHDTSTLSIDSMSSLSVGNPLCKKPSKAEDPSAIPPSQTCSWFSVVDIWEQGDSSIGYHPARVLAGAVSKTSIISASSVSDDPTSGSERMTRTVCDHNAAMVVSIDGQSNSTNESPLDSATVRESTEHQANNRKCFSPQDATSSSLVSPQKSLSVSFSATVSTVPISPRPYFELDVNDAFLLTSAFKSPSESFYLNSGAAEEKKKKRPSSKQSYSPTLGSLIATRRVLCPGDDEFYCLSSAASRFSPQRPTATSCVAVGTKDGNAYIIKSNGQPILSAHLHKGRVWDIDFAPSSGGWFASSSDDGTSKMWNYETGQSDGDGAGPQAVPRGIMRLPSQAFATKISRDESVVAVSGSSCTVFLRSAVNTSHTTVALSSPAQALGALAGCRFAAGSVDGSVHVLDAATQRVIWSNATPSHSRKVASLCTTSSDTDEHQSTFLTGSFDGSIKIWDTRQHTHLHQEYHPTLKSALRATEPITGLSCDGPYVAFCAGPSLLVVDRRMPDEIVCGCKQAWGGGPAPSSGTHALCRGIVVSAADSTIATASTDGVLRFWSF